MRGDEGARFENLVALSLLKLAWGRTDAEGKVHEVRYLRTKDGREVDFCLLREGHPTLLVEAKHGDGAVSRPLAAFGRTLGVPGVQVVQELRLERREGDVEVRQAAAFLAELRG